MLATVLLILATWAADIDYLASELAKQHPNPFFRTSRAEFQQRLDAIKGQSNDLLLYEIAVKLQQAVASLGDAHTELDTRIGPQSYYPLRLYAFSDGIFVTKTTEASRGACGAKLVAIDGVSADEVYARASTVVSHENDWWVRARTPLIMMRAELLRVLGVTDGAKARFTFESAGRVFDLELSPIGVSEAAQTIFAFDVTDETTPLYRRDGWKKYWYSWAGGVLYIKYNLCREDTAWPMAAFARSVFDIIDRERVDLVVIDLRDNTGGSSAVFQPVIEGLRARSQLRGRTYAIIGRLTFSSGMLNAIELRDRAGAVLVGEPTGGKPNGYGEVKFFQLPSSRLYVYHSTKYFKNAAGDPDALEPAIRAAVEAADFFAARDPVLGTLLMPQVAPVVPSAQSARRRRAVSGAEIVVCPR